jgi:hypothetical protein
MKEEATASASLLTEARDRDLPALQAGVERFRARGMT